MGVEELGKTIGCRCEHATDHGCGIYGNHPDSCKTWQCLWRQGELWGEDNRPDKLGLMFDTSDENGFPQFNCTELRPNAFDEARVSYLLKKSKFRHAPIAVFRYGQIMPNGFKAKPP